MSPHDPQQPHEPPSSPGKLVRGLGWASLGLGLPALLSPDTTARLIGVRPTAKTDAILRGVGAQELQVALPLMVRRRPAFSQWSRVAGDIAHLGLLAAAAEDGANDRKRVRKTMMAVAGITAIDVIAAIRLARKPAAPPLRSTTAITVKQPPETVYGYWRDLENLPDFMWHLESVESTGDNRSRWVAKGPAGKAVTWDAEIVDEKENERLAWRSLKGATVRNAGSVRFQPAPKDQGTEVIVELEYEPPAGRLGAKVAKIFGEHPEQQLRDDLRRFKQVMETGEVTLSSGTPDGTRTQRQLKQRPAQPLDNGKR